MIEQTMQDLTNAIRDLTAVLSNARVALPQPATTVSSAPDSSPLPSSASAKPTSPEKPSAPAKASAPAAPLSRAQLQDLFLRLGKEKGQDAMIQVLTACGVTKFGQVGEDQFPRFAQLCQHQLGVH